MSTQKHIWVFELVMKVLLGFLMVMPILGATGIFPEPTAEMYNTPEAYSFIQQLMSAGYLNYLMAIVFALALVAMIAKRMALAALLILPISINIVLFHQVLDGGLFKPGAIMGNVLLLINLYFLWKYREMYAPLFQKESAAK